MVCPQNSKHDLKERIPHSDDLQRHMRLRHLFWDFATTSWTVTIKMGNLAVECGPRDAE